MIIFHEGLPRSGKSYEAMVSRIVPAIKAGRVVIAYVEGINHAQIAKLAGVTEEQCRELLISLERDQLQTSQVDEKSGRVLKVEDHLPQLARDNAIIVLDEAQNFWGNRARLGPEMTQFIAEHGHRGIDIFLMGQDLRDVHAVWRRRVELKLSFLKLNGFGKMFANRYSCTTYRHLGGDEFKRVGVKINTYNPEYFGTYKSFTGDDINTEAYTDERGQVLGHPLLKYGLPAAVIAGLVGSWHLYRFFYPVDAAPIAAAAPAASAVPPGRTATGPAPIPVRVAASSPLPFGAAAAPAAETRSPIERRLVQLSEGGRIRLAGLVSMGGRTSGVVEWVRAGSVVVERLSLDALRTLGVGVLISGDSVQLAVGSYSELATPWPMEELGRASNAVQVAVRGPQPATGGQALPPGIAAGVEPPRFTDLPGPMVGGGLERRVTRAIQ